MDIRKMDLVENEITVLAEITDCHTGKISNKNCTLFLVNTKKNNWVVFANAHGAFTGFESFHINKRIINEGFPMGWLACVGRKGEYDKLFIPASEMERALKEFDIANIV